MQGMRKEKEARPTVVVERGGRQWSKISSEISRSE